MKQIEQLPPSPIFEKILEVFDRQLTILENFCYPIIVAKPDEEDSE